MNVNKYIGCVLSILTGTASATAFASQSISELSAMDQVAIRLFYPLLAIAFIAMITLIFWQRKYKKSDSIKHKLINQMSELNEQLEKQKRMLEQLSETDRLTRLKNRLFVDKAFEEMVGESEKTGKPLSVLLFDIDHFKSVNDTYGHNAGDAVLVAFGSIIKGVSRESDIAARWGGEEFLVLCPDTTNDEAFELADMLRKRIENHKFPEVGRCTTSIGGATHLNKEAQRDIGLRADNALYKAKQSGRNIVIRASEVLEDAEGH